MLHLRRAALRLLSSSPSPALSRSRTFASLTSQPVRASRQPTLTVWQRRWASQEVEAKKEEADSEAPISKLQPTPQEDVENAIHEDNVAETTDTNATLAEKLHLDTDPNVSASRAQDPQSGSADEARPEVSPVDSLSGGVRRSVRNMADKVQEAAAQTLDNESRPPRKYARPSGVDKSFEFSKPKETIYIGNLFFDVTENDLMKEVSRFGKVEKLRIMRDPRGLSKGYAYVDFETVEDASKAVEELNQTLFEGRRIAVQFAAVRSKDLETQRFGPRRSKPLNPPSKTLFIGNMSFEMTDRDLNSLFRGIRNVIDVRVAIDRRTGQPRGFAHADFVDVQSAMEAMKMLENKETYGRKLRLDFSYGPSISPRNEPAGQQQSSSSAAADVAGEESPRDTK